MVHRLRLLRRVNLGDLLPRVAAPALVISGTRDTIVSAANARALVAGLPDAQSAVIERAGHLAPLTHTAQAVDALTRFFSSAALVPA